MKLHENTPNLFYWRFSRFVLKTVSEEKNYIFKYKRQTKGEKVEFVKEKGTVISTKFKLDELV